ncbi:MAG: GNAT family N-acetyltransferase [Porcipelethomonas sp.]
MEKIVVCIEREEEISELLDNFSQCLPSLRKGKEFRNLMAHKFFSYGKVATAVDKNKNIMGFIAFYENNSADKTAYISMIAVVDNYKGKGIGTTLLKFAENSALSSGMKTVQLEVDKSNKKAIFFYEKNQYVMFSEKEKSFIYTKDIYSLI